MTRILTRKVPSGRGKALTGAKWRRHRAQGLQVLQAPGLAHLEWLVHGFSTRPGGASELNGGQALNLGFTDWDSREHVDENRTKFVRAIGASKMRAVTLRQIHSDIPHRVDASNAATLGDEAPQGDALFTREPGILLAVQTADCIPILLADMKQRVIAAIHSGWRGTVRRIVAKTLGRLQMEFGTRPEDMIAALGPGIGRCCYEVGSDVVREFQSQFSMAREWFDATPARKIGVPGTPGADPFDTLASGENDPNWLPWLTMRPAGHPLPEPRVNLDLIAANRATLIEAGVPAQQISASGFCTACRTDLFFSYRREGATGRMLAVIGISENSRT